MKPPEKGDPPPFYEYEKPKPTQTLEKVTFYFVFKLYLAFETDARQVINGESTYSWVIVYDSYFDRRVNISAISNARNVQECAAIAGEVQQASNAWAIRCDIQVYYGILFIYLFNRIFLFNKIFNKVIY